MDAGRAIQPGGVGTQAQRGGGVRQPGRVRVAAGEIGQRGIGQGAFLFAGLEWVADDRAQASLCHGNARGDKPPVGGGDRIAVHAQVYRQIPHGRQGCARR
ncbi:hypothetical protein G6F24_018624 [Rhizopus arrhizus]|nr:hypothetical protein G6F24_018624 [Rhizopus arrhizus]